MSIFSPSTLLIILTSYLLIRPTTAALAELDQIYYGVWLDTDVGYSDTPLAYNARLGRNASVFHIAQNMPLSPYNYTTGAGGPAPEYVIENTATDAAVFITVYPTSLTILTDNDYTVLANQVLAYQKDFNRTVFLRWAPEMQGRWNTYGQQPVQFVQSWQAMYRGIKTIAPATVIVWAPNLGSGYPFGQTSDITAADLAVLDTNKNGQLDQGDDPYLPYYPGDDYVDWIGLSVYFKQFSTNTNLAQPPGFCADILSGINTQSGTNTGFDWYNTYCTQKPSKACLIAESGAAYHPNVNTGTASQLQIQQAWWQDCITNTTFMATHPRLKLHMHFEYEKIEADIGAPDMRDYRLTNASNVLAAYQTDLNTVQDRYVWAQYRVPTAPIRTTGPGVSAPATATATVPTLILQTLRNPPVTGLPTLFGTKVPASDAWRVTIPLGVSSVTCLGSAVYLIGIGRARALRARRDLR